MTDSTSHPPGDSDPVGAPTEQATQLPIKLLRGNASAEELVELVAAVMTLTAAGGEDADPGGADGPSLRRGTNVRSLWSSPARLVRATAPHGPGGWRASAAPR